MRKLLYNLSVLGYLAIIKISALFNPKARMWLKGRRQIFKKLAAEFKDNKHKIAWFHCASLGEFEQGRTLIERFKTVFTDYKILLTFFSPSGYEIRKNYPHADFIFYLPIDSRINARKFLKITKPQIVFFIKYEFWCNYIREIAANDIPILSVSSIFRENQLFFKPYGSFYANILKLFNHFFVQNSKSKELLETINIKNVTLAGDTRFDRVKELVAKAVEVPVMEKFRNKIPLLVAGSTWPADMQILIPFINKFDLPLKVIIAPHEINSSQIEEFRNKLNKTSILFSEASFNSIHGFDVLIIDNVGMLSSLYRYGDVAYIGGGFGKGIHNILEPVTNGIPVLFGPNYSKFKEAVDLIQLQGAFSVKSSEEVINILSTIYNNEAKKELIEEICSDYINKNIGATEIILDYCKTIIR